jgi:hypothetical protein
MSSSVQLVSPERNLPSIDGVALAVRMHQSMHHVVGSQPLALITQIAACEGVDGQILVCVGGGSPKPASKSSATASDTIPWTLSEMRLHSWQRWRRNSQRPFCRGLR